MRKITEALRLKAAGLGNREIAASIGAGKTTVYEILARAEAAGLSWPLPDEVDEDQLEATLYPPPTVELAERRPVPDWREVHRELKRKRHVTLRLLWLEWRETHPEGWGYTQFCWHYREWLACQDVVMRLSYKAGERMFVDFSGDTMDLVDPETGEITKAEVFVAVLGCSGLLYVEATRGQDLRSWTSAHEHAFTHYGGVAEVTVPDNLRSGVTKACFYDPSSTPPTPSSPFTLGPSCCRHVWRGHGTRLLSKPACSSPNAGCWHRSATGASSASPRRTRRSPSAFRR